jgi:arginyl-tRNA synthetase
MAEVTGVAEVLSEMVVAALARVLPAGSSRTDPLLRRSDRADYQSAVALAVPRPAGLAPAELAGALAREVPGAVASGPGFLNLTAPDGLIWSRIALRAADSRLGVGTPLAGIRTVVDYSAPNAAKEMHVGHLRSTVIGDALVRVLGHLSAEVVRQNHLGDWGTQFGMLIQYRMEHPQTPDAELYPLARKAFDTDADFADRARKRVVALQSGDRPTRTVWRDLVASSEHSFQALYERLGVLLVPSDDAPESMYNPLLESVVSELAERGVAVESQGAWCVFLPGREAPLIVRKKDGGFGYAATDLAALRYRVRDLGADRILYLMDARQAWHLAMVCDTARLAGWLPDGVDVVHVAFGTVLGPDGRPFKSRAGGTVPLRELLDAAVDRARTVITGADESVVQAVAIGAVKYADLSTSRTKDYAFDLDRMMSFTGDTAVYLQLAHARARSILARIDGEPDLDPALDPHPAERELALRLDGFGATLHDVAQTLEPHRLCGYLFELAQAFSRFFESCPVLRADTAQRRANRAVLVRLTGDTLAQGLDLLGIAAPFPM